MAAKKPFRLHTVLRYKQQMEEQLQSKLQRLTQALAEAKTTHQQRQEQHVHSLHALRQREHIGISAAELLTYSAFLERLSAEMSRQTQVIANLDAEVQQARQRLEQAIKERKVIENLHERTSLMQKQQMRRDEERTMAEIALRRFAL